MITKIWFINILNFEENLFIQHFCNFQYISNKMQHYTVYCIWKLLYMFRVVPPPIIRSAYNCIYSVWYLSHRYCYLPLAAGSSNGVTNTRHCRYSCMRSWWWVGVPPETCRAVSSYNKMCNVASCWIYIGIFLWCTDPWTLNFCNFDCSATCWYKCSTSNQCKSKLSHMLM